MSFAKKLLHPANIIGDVFFKKQKQPKSPTLPTAPQYGDPAVRQAEADLKLQQKTGYAGTVLTGQTTQAIQNRSTLMAALGMQPTGPVASPPTMPGPGAGNWQSIIGNLNLGSVLP